MKTSNLSSLVRLITIVCNYPRYELSTYVKSLADLESKRISLKIPNINGDFENIVIDNKYGLFVAAIVAFNDERVDQSTCERAWESLVYEKFYKWQPEDMTIKEKADVLGEALAQACDSSPSFFI